MPAKNQNTTSAKKPKKASKKTTPVTAPAPAPAEPKAEESAPVEQQASGEKPSADDILNMIRNRS